MNITLRQEIIERGYAILNDYGADADGEEIVAALGYPVALSEGSPVHRVIPTAKANTTPNTYSGIYGLESFPFHTDMAHWRHPPRFLMLRCIVGFNEVSTLLADGIEIVGKTESGVLSRALVLPRRSIKGKLPLLRIHQPSEDFGLIRWDEVFLKPATRTGEIGVKLFRAAVSSVSKQAITLANRGDILIIDNWRMLHARSSVPPGCEGRILERAYLERLH